ncbi:MAG: hypothetical protein AABY64_01550 [Bdellovibrionota bacterium]
MSLQTLDLIFPLVVFFYGLLLLIVLENPFLQKLGTSRMSTAYTQLSNHRPLAWISFFIGGLWSLQNLLLT